MPYNKDTGLIYVDTEQGLGISTGDVAEAIGIASDDYGTLCSSTNIRRLAKYKPYETLIDIKEELTEDRIISDDCGLIIQSYMSPDEAMDAAINNDRWPWNPPVSNFRILDFNGYCHKCTKHFYDLTLKSIWGLENQMMAGIECDLAHINESELPMNSITFNSLGAFKDNLQNYKWCLVYRKKGETTSAVALFSYVNNEEEEAVDTFIGDSFYMLPRVGTTDAGDTSYDVCIGIFNNKEGEEAYYLLDGSHREVTLNVKTAEEYSNFIFQENWYIKTGNKNKLYFQLYLTNKNEDEQNVLISYYIKGNVSKDMILAVEEQSVTFSALESNKNIIVGEQDSDYTTMSSTSDESGDGNTEYYYEVRYKFVNRRNVVVIRQGTFSDTI